MKDSDLEKEALDLVDAFALVERVLKFSRSFPGVRDPRGLRMAIADLSSLVDNVQASLQSTAERIDSFVSAKEKGGPVFDAADSLCRLVDISRGCRSWSAKMRAALADLEKAMGKNDT